jgi:hypothetical protein
MATFQFHPRLPQELHDKILSYIINDETIQVQTTERGKKIIEVTLIYSPTLNSVLSEEEIAKRNEPTS